MNPNLSREMVMARQQDALRSAAHRRLVAEAKNARRTNRPARHGIMSALAAQLAVITRPRKVFRARPV